MGRVLLALLSLPAVAFAQEAGDAVRLEARAGYLGDRIELQVDSSLDVDIVVKDGQGERTLQFSHVQSETFRQEVTAVEDGMAGTFRVVCRSSKLQRSGTNLPLKSEVTAVEGKEFVIRRTGSAAMVQMADGSEMPAGSEGVGSWEEFGRLFPSKAVRVDEQWVIDKDLTSFLTIGNLEEMKTATLTGTLKSLDGDLAVVGFSGVIEGKTKDKASIKVAITEGEMAFNTARGRPISIRLSGSLEAVKDVITMYQRPGQEGKVPERIGEIRTKSRRLEVRIAFRP